MTSRNLGRRRNVGLVFATASGGTAIDQDERGGNPFATALIELSTQPDLTLRVLPTRLRTLTYEKSGHHQATEWKCRPQRTSWRFGLQPGSRTERRSALVLIVSAYPQFPAASLSGAATDERRIAAMLAANGFSVTQGVAPQRRALLGALDTFARQSKDSDVALIYSTGHGIEIDGEVHLVPGDYPFTNGFGRCRESVVRPQ